VLTSGNEKLRELDEALAKVAKDDWSMPRVRRELEDLRATALKRAGELPSEAVHRLANGTRTPVQSLAKGLADIAKRFEPAAKPPAAKAEAAKKNGGKE
jgi:hypothetical protein